MEETKHSFPPAAAPDAELLFLGSLPGDESLRQAQYYAHPRNAFWRIMGELFGFDHLLPYGERLAELRRNRVALWDVVGSGVRPGSLDTAIREHRPNDIPGLLARCPGIRAIGCNGSTSHKLLKRHYPELFGRTELTILVLPSTSPAAARLRYEEKLAAFREMLRFRETQ